MTDITETIIRIDGVEVDIHEGIKYLARKTNTCMNQRDKLRDQLVTLRQQLAEAMALVAEQSAEEAANRKLMVDTMREWRKENDALKAENTRLDAELMLRIRQLIKAGKLCNGWKAEAMEARAERARWQADLENERLAHATTATDLGMEVYRLRTELDAAVKENSALSAEVELLQRERAEWAIKMRWLC